MVGHSWLCNGSPASPTHPPTALALARQLVEHWHEPGSAFRAHSVSKLWTMMERERQREARPRASKVKRALELVRGQGAWAGADKANCNL